MGSFDLDEAQVALRLNMFRNRDNIALFQIYVNIDVQVVVPSECFLLVERTRRDASLASLTGKLIYHCFYSEHKNHERHEEDGSPINLNFDFSERDSPSPVSLILSGKL